MQKKKFKVFKYLHRDGDVDMSYLSLVKREISEMNSQIALAHKKMDFRYANTFSKWSIY